MQYSLKRLYFRRTPGGMWACFVTDGKSEEKYPAYGHYSTLLYVSDSGVPILYRVSRSIPWVLSIL